MLHPTHTALGWHRPLAAQNQCLTMPPCPGDHEAVVNCGGDEFGEEDDWRVKGVCAFSRSLGDFQLKDSAAATVYNTYTQGYKIEPRPGIVPPRGESAAAREGSGSGGGGELRAVAERLACVGAGRRAEDNAVHHQRARPHGR